MADKTMGALDSADLPLMTSDNIAVSRGGTTTKKATLANLLALIGAGSGDVVGPASATDNTLPRYNGTTGKLLQGSGINVDDDNKIDGYRAQTNSQSGTTYTFQASDAGKIVVLANASPITAEIPNSLPQGWTCTVLQSGAGQATFDPASGATLHNRQSHDKTAGQWAMATLYVVTNAGGSSAVVVLAGDTAA